MGMSLSESGKLGAIASALTNKRLKLLRILRYYCNPKKCKKCGNIISYKKRKNDFCCHRCGYKNNRVNGQILLKEHTCLNCGRKYIHKYHNTTSKFCSSKCASRFIVKQNFNNIEQCGSFKNDYVARQTGKRYLIQKRGHKCEICGISEWLGEPILLILDHIDGDNRNNRIDNCRLVCSNCDATLPTYKGRNKGKANRDRTKYKSRY